MECLRIGISIERKRIRHEMNTKSRQYGADWERYVGNSRILWYGSASCHSEWEYPQVVEPWNSQMMTLTFLFLSKRLRICTVVSERKNQASDRSWLQGLNHRGLTRQTSRQSVSTLLTVEFHSTGSTFTDHGSTHITLIPYYPIQYYAQGGRKRISDVRRSEGWPRQDIAIRLLWWALCISGEMVSPLPKGISGDTRQCLTDD